ncbi:hypothetical protein ACIBCN_39665 [Nocardia sp. NPDC051052]|uniref:hypothetical protein n=1 Tax=Nocardia sp. NPDC051052 TaxID=3364322 RepID=UPI003798AF65
MSATSVAPTTTTAITASSATKSSVAPTTGTAVALTARAVVDAIAAEGLSVLNPRDTTAQLRKNNWGCVQLITTDQFSVYQFDDTTQATKVANAFPSGHLNGLIFLRFTRDGSHPTNLAMIPRYEAVLDRLTQ